MAKRSVDNRDDELEQEVNFSDDAESPEEVSEVLVISLIDGKVTTSVNGHEYVFGKAGSILLIPLEDAQILVEKRKRSCCGSSTISNMFQIIEG